MSVVIRVENISKLYKLGTFGSKTIAQDLNRWWAGVRGKEDPMIKIGETNDRTSKGTSDYVWSLKDVSFDVNQGEVLGVIGKNGAGKSTLLKILSRVTSPTTGRVRAKGRIASLLEVGTGFHPELTGKENVYLNGAILGMSKKEITSKWDEIVDFSGVERYINTPVKRYSSGMYVRLAFAVAAHLEPEILIIDEVLAVGDAEFQKKCLGKMESVATQGRTVLFVSHNLGMINTLCRNAILLNKGRVDFNGPSSEAIEKYLQNATTDIGRTEITPEINPDVPAQILHAKIVNAAGEACLSFDVFDEIYIEAEYEFRTEMKATALALTVERNGEMLFASYDSDTDPDRLKLRKPGRYKTKVRLPHPMKSGKYNLLALVIGKSPGYVIHEIRDVFSFHIEDRSFDPTYVSYKSEHPAKMMVLLDWKENKL